MTQHANWREVLRSVRNDGPNSGNFYVIKIDDTRTRFMDQQECIDYCVQKINQETSR